jgi:hypothetical protein
MLYNINVKFLEILTNLVREQNMQLLQILCEEENLNYRELVKDIPSRFELKRMMDNMNTHNNAPTQTEEEIDEETEEETDEEIEEESKDEQDHLREVKSNSTSESSVPPPDSDEE